MGDDIDDLIAGINGAIDTIVHLGWSTGFAACVWVTSLCAIAEEPIVTVNITHALWGDLAV